ncbi:hypothetical protein [Endozoicomonas ascidiicola]|uniref:hypothetical protein n=1 Tax=Endozoicomonas ascidiicola TaxID=1698521 RepID=UPI00082B5C23|nr:hypothetical protein [Endozoicomonas ascidiicola]
MQTLSEIEFNELRQGGRVIESDGHGEKVIQLPDESYLKLFRRKHLISSELLKPYAQRFADNAAALIQLCVPTVDISGVYNVPAIQRKVVHYEPLQGDVLRSYLKSSSPSEREQLAIELGQFIATLHDSGVYFRSLHMGNIVRTVDRGLGLIDIADMRCLNRPFKDSERLRNFQHMIRYSEDMMLFGDAVQPLLNAYHVKAKSSDSLKLALKKLLPA